MLSMLVMMFKTYQVLPKRNSSPKYLLEMINFVMNYLKDMGCKLLIPFIKNKPESMTNLLGGN